jgi:hypothetical protein
MGSFGKCGGGGRRSASRQSAPLIALLSGLTRTHSAILVDLSQTGARVRGDDLPCEGEELIIAVEGFRSFASVSWNHDGECGLAFEAPLPNDDFAALCGKASKSRGLSPEDRAAFDDWTVGLAR